MSQRRRLPNSLRLRAVGWMEMGLSQADVARRVSMCLVVLFSDFGINTNPKILCPEDLFQADHELQHLQKTVFSSFGTKEKNHYCAAARCRPLSSIRKKNLRYYGAKSSSQCRYRDEILDPYVRPYAAAIGNDFNLMDDNARLTELGLLRSIWRITVWNEWNGQLDLQT
ncbi:uncharacterized protein TNCV_3987721 [Trichonephila clavipes]|nr:uncharacterized protein TNCV_3987721 [Trichonephila clavipes]